MQLGLIFGIVFAIVAALFAMQNIAPVTVNVGFWSFEGSLSLVLLVTLGLGALIAGLVTSPAVIRCQWNVTRMTQQVAGLEGKLAEAERRYDETRAELSRVHESASMATLLTGEPPADEKPYVGLRALMSGDDGKPKL